MSKIAVVYWSGTGNTEAMANEVAEGAKAAGAEVDVLTASEFGADKMDAYDAVAFGCPAMGAEELEDSEFEPMFSDCEGKLGGKKIALFGSYGWGDGEWMRTWEETCKADGAVLACESVLANEAPDDEAVAACQALGKALCQPGGREKWFFVCPRWLGFRNETSDIQIYPLGGNQKRFWLPLFSMHSKAENVFGQCSIG